MSYISATTSKNGEEIIVWERNEARERIVKTYPAPYYFYISDENGKDVTIYNNPVSKVIFRNAKDLRKAKRDYESRGIRTWESDISAETRVLSEVYYNAPVPKLNVTFYDIEVDYDPTIGFSSVTNPYAPINSISIFHNWCKKLVVIAIPPELGWTVERLQAEVDNAVEGVPVPPEFDTTYILCENEAELLLNVLEEFKDSDVLCGWNSNNFDLPYIVRRLMITLDKTDISLETKPGDPGQNQYSNAAKVEYVDQPNTDIRRWGKFTKMLDVEIDGEVTFRPIVYQKTGRTTAHMVDLVGKINADYLDLYKKYEQSGKPSYKLAAIEEEVELKLPKLEYEGSLANLYRENFAFFVRYNIRDTEILHGFENQLGYVELANVMYHTSCGLFKHVGGTLKLAELAIINHCHHEINQIVNNSDKPDIDESIDGAFVLLPQIGLHEKTGSIDIGSLYPNGIRTINISPETIRGQFEGTVGDSEAISELAVKMLTLAFDDGRKVSKYAYEWNEWLRENKMSVSGYGTVFDQSKIGIIPSIITGWITTRKKYQALKKDAEKNGDELLANYYDRLQYVYKIKLNSLYGALTNLYFRFYDLRMGESTTGTGRMILKHQCRKVAEILDGNYNVDFPLYATIEDAMEKDKAGNPRHTLAEAQLISLNGPKFNGKFQSESVVYGDTDSTYFLTHGETVDEAILLADAVAKVVNASYPEFVTHKFLCQPEFSKYITANREIVSDRGIFVDKKRYILHIVDKEGKKKDEMKVMGLDTKKTTLPTTVSKKLNHFIERFLKGETWEDLARDIVKYKDELKNSKDIMAIGLPKGVNKMEEYTEMFEEDPMCTLRSGGAAASIHYNECLKEFDDKISMDIKSGMKIKVFYLMSPHGRFKTIAIPTDVEVVPAWFLENFKVDKNAHILRLVDNPLTNIIKAIGKNVPTKHSLMVDDLLGF